jgi:predicted secreted hydrolase
LIRRKTALLSALVTLCLTGAEFRYREALPGFVYSFPADHFSHPDFRTEWWYYTGNVTDTQGKRFGFEVVFFRQGTKRDGRKNPSTWRVDDVYLAHAALTDINGKHFYYSERTNRAGPGVAGASQPRAEVWNGNWAAKWTGEKQALTALTEDFQFDLRAEPLKPFVINGLGGVSQKANGEGRASHYISFPRLGVSGNVKIGGQDHAVRGLAWMDHEWFTEQLDPNEVGWDWFSVQLEDRTEVMLFELRKKDGTLDSHSSGTYVDASGKAKHLTADDFKLRPLAYWNKYPVKWRIEIPALRIGLDCEAALQNQELKTAGARYWEGAVTYSGSKKGAGYLEMTGYDKPVSFH